MVPVTAPVAGVIVAVHAVPGQRVSEGEGIVSIEVMKTEMLIPAPSSGVVREIHVEAGQMIESEAVIAVIE